MLKTLPHKTREINIQHFEQNS